MHATTSTKRLAFPLQEVAPPMLATSRGVRAQLHMSLLVKPVSAWRSAMQISDSNGQHLFDIKCKALSMRCTLHTPNGSALVSMKPKTFSSDYRVYDPANSTSACFEIRVGRHLMHADFRDQQAGREYRVVLGNAYDDVVVIYLEYGPLAQLPKPTRDDVADGSRFQAIARIQRVKKQYLVEVAAGVDITLIVLFWQVWKHQEVAREAGLGD